MGHDSLTVLHSVLLGSVYRYMICFRKPTMHALHEPGTISFKETCCCDWLVHRTSSKPTKQLLPSPPCGMPLMLSPVLPKPPPRALPFHLMARAHFSGMKREEWVAPMPGLPCFTGL